VNDITQTSPPTPRWRQQAKNSPPSVTTSLPLVRNQPAVSQPTPLSDEELYIPNLLLQSSDEEEDLPWLDKHISLKKCKGQLESNIDTVQPNLSTPRGNLNRGRRGRGSRRAGSRADSFRGRFNSN
jgi:hypothetical protein